MPMYTIPFPFFHKESNNRTYLGFQPTLKSNLMNIMDIVISMSNKKKNNLAYLLQRRRNNIVYKKV